MFPWGCIFDGAIRLALFDRTAVAPHAYTVCERAEEIQDSIPILEKGSRYSALLARIHAGR